MTETAPSDPIGDGSGPQKPVQLDSAADYDELLAAHDLVLLEFVTSGCGICASMEPVLGAVADYSAAKKRFLRAFAYGGSLFVTLLVFAGSGNVLLTLGFFLLAQVGFVGANVFYDGFLPDITTPDTIDKVSSRGFALGYIGGGLWLAVVLAGIFSAGDDADLAVLITRIGIGATGIWWAGFTAFAMSRLPETGGSSDVPAVE